MPTGTDEKMALRIPQSHQSFSYYVTAKSNERTFSVSVPGLLCHIFQREVTEEMCARA